MRPRTAWWAGLVVVAGNGCTTLVGLDDVQFTSGAGGTGAGGTGAGGTGGSTATGGSDCGPLDDDKECTDDVCTPDGSVMHLPRAASTPCTEAGGKLCNAAGSCVACLGDANCTPPEVCNVVAGTCNPIPPGCGDGTANGMETCDDANATSGDGCSSSCQIEPGFQCTGSPSACAPICGNAIITAGEQCDDGNDTSDDGCSDACQVEALFQCVVGPPSVCTKHEVLCADGNDNDADGQVDAADADCALPPWVPPCAPGLSLRVYNAVGLPAGIPDDAYPGARSPIFVFGNGIIVDVSVVVDVTHPRDSDLTFTVTPPMDFSYDLCSSVGGAGDNFTDTVFSSACDMTFFASAPPFSDCFAADDSLDDLTDANAKGVWTLEVEDEEDPDTGTLNGWALVLCTQ